MCSGQVSSVQSLDRLDHQEDWQTIKQRSSSSLFCWMPLCAVLAWAGMSPLDCPASIPSSWSRHPSPSKVPWRMVLKRPACRVAYPKHATFRLLPVARRDSCRPTRKLILLCKQSMVLCLKKKMQRSFLRHWFWTSGSFSQSQHEGSIFHSHRGGWRWQETCATWTSWRNRWFCLTGSCLTLRFLPICWGNSDKNFC